MGVKAIAMAVGVQVFNGHWICSFLAIGTLFSAGIWIKFGGGQ